MNDKAKEFVTAAKEALRQHKIKAGVSLSNDTLFVNLHGRNSFLTRLTGDETLLSMPFGKKGEDALVRDAKSALFDLAPRYPDIKLNIRYTGPGKL